MLVVISPAKTLDWTETDVAATRPDFLKEAGTLAGHARQLTLGGLKDLMGLSDDLARLNRERFKTFQSDPDPEATRPAALAFAGDTYRGLEARTLEPEDLDWAQDHLRILSGLYGLLRPRDAIQPYRLEMGSKLKSRRGKDLYAFWGSMLAKALNAQAETVGTDILVNCASQEYFGAVDRTALRPRVITPQFLELKDDLPPTLSFFAKVARGAMARYIVTRHLQDPEALEQFDLGGYAHAPELSEPDRPAFLRPYPSG